MTLPPLHPCPHCAAPLAVSTRTPDGERSRCGTCRGPVAWEGGTVERADPPEGLHTPRPRILQPFNANDYVWVGLTLLGVQIAQRYWAPYDYVSSNTDDRGCTRFQLWQLMAIFGEHMGNGRPNPFDMSVEFELDAP